MSDGSSGAGPVAEKIGDGVSVRWPVEQVGYQFERVRESDTGLVYAEMVIRSMRAEASGRLYGPARVCLSQPAAEAKRIDDYLGPTLPLRWTELTVVSFALGIDKHRQPEPAVILADTVASPDNEYLCHPIMPTNETTVVMADRESGKSYLALTLAVGLDVGRSLIPGLETLKTGPTLYLDWETTQPAQWRRLLRVANGAGLVPPPRRLIYRRMDRPIAFSEQVIQRDIAEHKPVLIVIDSLAWAAGGDLNNNETGTVTMSCIDRLPGTKLVLAHYSKGDRANPNARASVYGNMFFEAKPRSIWEVRRQMDDAPGQLTIGLYQSKTSDDGRFPPIAVRAMWDRDRNAMVWHGYDVADSAELSARLPRSAQARLYLERHDGPASTRDVAEHLGITEGNARMVMGRTEGIVAVSGASGGRGKGQLWVVSGNRKPHAPIVNSERAVSPALDGGRETANRSEGNRTGVRFPYADDQDVLAMPF